MKPIETAPMDGTLIVIWDGEEFITFANWDTEYEFWSYPNCEMDDPIDFKYWTDKPVVL